jgi:hypothetical protein
VQVANLASDVCWGATFDAADVLVDTATLVKAKAKN